MRKEEYPTVTVIMTTFNSSETVEAAVASVMQQDYPSLELLIVDDKSSDDTVKIIRRLVHEYKDHHHDINYIRNTRNVGTYVSKNKAIQVASGEYITGHDSDDTAEKNYVTELMKPHINKQPGVKITAVECAGRSASATRKTTVFCCISQCFPKSLVEEIGYFDSVRFAADSEYYKRCIAIFGKSSVLRIKKTLYLVSRSQTSLTGNSKTGLRSEPRKQYVRMYSRWHKSTTKQGLSEAFRSFPLKKRPFGVHPLSVRGLPRLRVSGVHRNRK